MPDEDIKDAEPFEDEEDYEDEYDNDEEENGEEEDLLFGKIPRTPGLIGIAAIFVVILLLLAALVSNGFGFVGGISDLNVSIPNNEGELTDEKLEINAQSSVPAFGKDSNGNGELRITYDGEEVYSSGIKFKDSRASENIPYEEFYVDNGEYTAEITYEGVTESDTILLQRTAHAAMMVQFDYVFNDVEKVRYSVSFFPESTDDTDDILVPGHGKIEFYYVEDESDTTDEAMWENVTYMDITTTFTAIELKMEGEKEEELTVSEGFFIDITADKLAEKSGHDEGWYSARVYFTNDYGLEDKGAYTGWINAMPEEISGTSYTWIKVGDGEGS